MTIDEACLQCHGEPAGELDVTGTRKEGWKMGDIGGAISIIMPLDVYQANERDSIAQDVLFFAVMLAVCLVVVYVALTYLVTRPLGKIRSGVDEVSEGNLDVRLSYSESSQEMSSLTTAFNDMAHELADVYAGLEDEVADRTAQLQQANEVLEQQRRQLEAVNAQLVDENQYKSDFLSMVSHELRTPLTSIVAFADLLSKHRAGADENEAKALAGIEANSQALMLMINDILEMSRLDAGRVKLSLEVVDVGDVVGILTFYSENEGTAEYELVATRSIAARADAPLTLEQIEAYTAQDESPWPRFSWDLLVPPGLILLALIWLIRFIRRHRKKRIKAPKIKPIKKKYLR